MAIDPALEMEMSLMSQVHSVFDAEAQGGSPIQKIYQDTSVFITGGTGFLGKQLLEKLLRACHGIKNVYLLIRKKKTSTIEERLKKQLEDPLYDELRKRQPNFSEKIIAIEGDIQELRLGMSDENWNLLAQEVNFIFHVAATISFDEPLKRAILINVRATREALRLARDCSGLKSFVYVSTAYSHCYKQVIAEEFYDSPVPPQTMIEFVETVDESKIDAITPSLKEGWPNTYTFSKAIAEEAVRTMGKGLPVCVVRPAFVISSYREPVPGWLDLSGVFGPSGTLLGSGLGALHTVLLHNSTKIDMVPVDLVNNLTISAAWETATNTSDNIQIYTLSQIRNRMTMEEVQNYFRTHFKKIPTPRAFWYNGWIVTSNKHMFLLLSIFLHIIPAFLIDGILSFTRHKLRLTKLYLTNFKLTKVLYFFIFLTWDHKDDNSVALKNKMSKLDQEIFQFDMAGVDNEKLIAAWWLGVRKYIIKDELKGTDSAVKKQRWLRYVNYVVFAIYLSLIFVICNGMFKLVKYILFHVCFSLLN